ncbi:hypothetical protein GT370_19530 [Acidocella sp. MX-AZ03]|uniref:hypothetical protein n=1 Tax=Acidocella sp. MX-AZ03 TaxID=2697363 RepID=UPI0022DD1C0E|nr:hypothetical protein [Acidocella sp. MX-AZ03]WBO59208.1 hypothetical protein GT370_19530 [Acidocella sp. MX-AZ03]
MDYARRFYFDIAFMGISTVDINHGWMDYEEHESVLRRALKSQARRGVILVDSSKFGRQANLHTFGLHEALTIVTDRPPPPAFMEVFKQHDIELIATPDASALLALLDRFAAIGATAAGGVTRLCGSAEDGQARALFRSVAQAAGARVTIDEVGNQFALFPLAQGAAPAVMMGSHLDTQMRAGRFDGTLGVATALCVGEALLQARRQGAGFNADFIAVNWTNEEGARFRPSLLGSGTYAGSFTPDYALTRCDDQGVSLGAALDAIGSLGTDLPPLPRPAIWSCISSRAACWRRRRRASASSPAIGAR